MKTSVVAATPTSAGPPAGAYGAFGPLCKAKPGHLLAEKRGRPQRRMLVAKYLPTVAYDESFRQNSLDYTTITYSAHRPSTRQIDIH
jgi:hypothetical protein